MPLLRLAPLLLSLLALLSPVPASATLLFVAAPRGSEAEERALYEPLARAMSEWLGSEVSYEYPRDYTTYSFRMREGRYDLVLDGAHFADWRRVHQDHELLLTLPSPLTFLVVGPRESSSLEGLIGKRVCAHAPPHLGTLTLFAEFKNPAREPVLQVVSGENAIQAALTAGECAGAVLRDSTWARLTPEQQAAYRVLHRSRPLPNHGLTAGPRVTAVQRAALVARLTDPATAGVARGLFDLYDKKADHFVKADPATFTGLHKLLQLLSFGW